MTAGPAVLGGLRDALLDEVLGLLRADPEVDGVALIGSLGRGEGDNWSDIDLLVLMGASRVAGRWAAQLAGGPRQPATVKTADEVREIHLSYVPVAGKYIARRSPAAVPMIRFLGDRPDFAVDDPAGQLRALREVTAGLSDPSWSWLVDAVSAHLDLVEVTL